MLKLENISKSYKTGSFYQKALDNVSIEFRKNEFVAILGQSGSGKTTLLNIIGGLDRYDDGDLIINNKSTKTFKNSSWDSYRNNCVGFIFQSYNLITHINVLENVEMAMTLSGKKKKQRRKQAIKVLEKVGLKDHIYKKPNQLSGGQMQRVAIARALVNDPDIILADEPTGALDSATSVQIMELIKEISKDKLVIMVTHNPELAQDYASRIIELKDGKVIKDNEKFEDSDNSNKAFNINKTSMSFIQALKLSFNNIKTKKGRTLLTAFASSIGIIGIALILALSNGFDIQIDKFENDTLSSLPIIISKESMNISKEAMENIANKENSLKEFSDKEKIYPFDILEQLNIHHNKIDNDYIEYIKKFDSKYYSGISYGKMTNLLMLVKNNDEYKQIDLSKSVFPLPKNDDNKNNFVNNLFDLIYGKLPQNKNELLLIVDSKNRINSDILDKLGFDNKDEISFDEILNKEIKLTFNDIYYKNIDGNFIGESDLEKVYNDSKNLTLKITGIIRGKESKKTIVGSNMGISYTEELINYIISINKDSEIVKKQQSLDYNILTGQKFTDDSEKENTLMYLGSDSVPNYIYIYPNDFKSKEEIIKYLDNYNKDKKNEDKILYLDQAEMISTLSSSIMDAITIVLIAFSAISLVVSSIMIGIITYISVLERTKEIGILRSLGARGKDISRVFTAEVFIIGLSSGLIGLLIARILCIPTNIIIKNLTDLSNVARLSLSHSLILLIVSISLTLIGGIIPSKIASKKDPVEALRTE